MYLNPLTREADDFYARLRLTLDVFEFFARRKRISVKQD